MLYVKEFALYLGRNRDPWKGFLFVCLFFKRERDTYDLCLRKSLWLVGGDRTWAKIGRQEEGLEAGCRLLGRDSEAQPRQWGWGCRERDASESGGLTAQAGKNGKSLLKAAGKNPKHLRVLKMSTSGFFFFFFFQIKEMSHWSEPCVSFHERWRGPSAFGGEQSSCKGWCSGTGSHSPSALSVNCTQDQLCFLCLLTSSPVIKTLPRGIVLTIWAVMYETKESRG